MRKRYPKEIPITYDVHFKYQLINNLSLIERIYQPLIGSDEKVKEIKNPNIIPLKADQKNTYFDVLVKTRKGTLIDIEMQNSPISVMVSQRMQSYNFRLANSQFKIGKRKKHPTAYVIALINDHRKHKKLIERHLLRSDTKTILGNLTCIIYVYLSAIENIVDEKGISGLNRFERIVYALYYNLNDDILKVEDKEVFKMEENRIAFHDNDGNIFSYAEQLQWKEMEEAERRYKQKRKTKHYKRKAKIAQKKLQEIQNEQAQYIHNVMTKLNLNYDEAVAFLRNSN